MPTQTNKSPMPIRGLLLLEYLVDNDVVVVTASHGVATRGFSFLKRPTREAPRVPLPDGAPDIDAAVYESLRARGCLSYSGTKAVEAEAGLHKRLPYVDGKPDPNQKEPHTPFAWYDSVSEVNDLGREILGRGRARIAEWRREQAGKRDEFVVVGRRRKAGVAAFCKVVNRTDKRVYVQVLDRVDTSYEQSVIEGQKGKEYVAHEHVMATEADASTWRRLRQATLDHDESLRRADAALRERLAPIHSEHEGRLKQLAAAFEDEVKEALGQAPPPLPR